MRLIDADELRRWLNGYLETDNISPTYIRALIDSQQTVEAIPIEWIKKKLDKLKDDIKWAWYYGNTMLEKMEWTETWIQVVLLEEWEKENETDRR